MSTTLRPAALEQFFAHCHRRTYPAKAVLIKGGDRSNELYYLIQGSVSVIIEDDAGHEIVLAYLNDGDFFGEIGMFDERRERSAWVRARTPIEVAYLSYETLKVLANTHPDIIYALLSQLAGRLRRTNRKLGDLAFTDVSGRVARSLLDLCAQPDAVPRARGKEVRITRQELARLAGCSREMVSRVLRTLEDRRIISIVGRSILVYDP